MEKKVFCLPLLAIALSTVACGDSEHNPPRPCTGARCSGGVGSVAVSSGGALGEWVIDTPFGNGFGQVTEFTCVGENRQPPVSWFGDPGDEVTSVAVALIDHTENRVMWMVHSIPFDGSFQHEGSLAPGASNDGALPEGAVEPVLYGPYVGPCTDEPHDFALGAFAMNSMPLDIDVELEDTSWVALEDALEGRRIKTAWSSIRWSTM